MPPRRAQWGVGRLWHLPVPEGAVLGVRAKSWGGQHGFTPFPLHPCALGLEGGGPADWSPAEGSGLWIKANPKVWGQHESLLGEGTRG